MDAHSINSLDAEALCREYSDLVHKVCNRYRRHLSQIGYADYDDIKQAGNVGLLQAQKTFHAEAGASFTSWAYLYINREICRELGIIWRGKGKYKLPPLEAHLDEPINANDPDGETLADTIADIKTIDAEAEAICADSNRIIMAAIDRLQEPERGIIRENILENRSLKDMAKDAGLPYWRIQEHKNKGLRHLRRMRLIRDLYDDAACYQSKSVEAFQRTGSSAVEDLAFERILLSNTT